MGRERSSARAKTELPFVAVVALAMLLVIVTSARAEIMFNFTVQVKDSKKDGTYKVVLNSRTYETGGGKIEALDEIQTRLPYGLRIRSKGFPVCNVNKLEKTRDRKTCRKSQIGSGTALTDARPLFAEPISSKVYLFLGKPSSKKSVASFVTLALPQSSNPLISGIKPVLIGPVVNDPSPDHRFGYRMKQELKIDTPFPTLVINVPEINLTIKGLTRTVRKVKCLKRSNGKCISKRTTRKKVSLFSDPKCPASKKLSFGSSLVFKSSTPPLERETQVKCFKFKN